MSSEDRSPYILSVTVDGEKIVESRLLNNDEARRLAGLLHLPFPAWSAHSGQDRVGVTLESTKALNYRGPKSMTPLERDAALDDIVENHTGPLHHH